MDLLMNGLLTAATLFAGGYCWVLARRVRALKSLDSGLGGAIVTLTRQVELARTTLEEARAASRDTRQDLAQLVAKADGAAGQLRMLLAVARVPAAPVAAAPVPEAPAPAPAPAVAPAPVAAAVPAAEAPERAAAAAAPAPAPATVAPAAEPAPVIAIRPVPQPEPAVPARAAIPHLAEVPKPRALAPIENPLRRKDAAAAEPAQSEDDIIEALSALAGGR